jgi:hypothetical protein
MTGEREEGERRADEVERRRRGREMGRAEER